MKIALQVTQPTLDLKVQGNCNFAGLIPTSGPLIAINYANWRLLQKLSLVKNLSWNIFLWQKQVYYFQSPMRPLWIEKIIWFSPQNVFDLQAVVIIVVIFVVVVDSLIVVVAYQKNILVQTKPVVAFYYNLFNSIFREKSLKNNHNFFSEINFSISSPTFKHVIQLILWIEKLNNSIF